MRNTLKFGSFFGIPVRIHFTFPLILIAFGLEAGLRGGVAEAVWAVLLIMSVFACVVLHELGHSLQVRRYGIDVRDIILLPIGGMARAEKIPENPRQEIIVAIAGPIVNFAIATVLFTLMFIGPGPLDFDNRFLVNLLFINLVLGVFNLIPAFPMDGGRILRGILAMRMDYLKATRYAKNVGQIIAIAFVVIGFKNTNFIMLPLVAVFVFVGAMTEERIVRIKFGLGDKCARDFARTQDQGWQIDDAARAGMPLIDGDTPATQLYYFLRSHKRSAAAITHNGELLGVVHIDDLAKAVG